MLSSFGKRAAVSAVVATVIAATSALLLSRSGLRAAAAEASSVVRAPDVSQQDCEARAYASSGEMEPAAMHSFYFTRVAYSGGGGWGRRRGRSGWLTDGPKSDRQFLIVFRRLLGIDAYDCEHYLRLDDPSIRKFPFLYALEVGSMGLGPEEVKNLRDYLLAGGFLMVDDFWGDGEWQNFEYEIRQVLPEYDIVELPLDHPIFRSFYEIKEILQVPNVGNARSGWTSECGPCQPHALGILDEKGRVMVVINWNTDIGDAWEWAEQPFYPLKYSTFAYQMGVNFIVYAMSH
ncbi:MAG: DUF4159 domain-containing protein [Longimicrobiales bacterium]